MARLCIESCYELPGGVLDALTAAAKTETSGRAVKILNQLIENADIAVREHIPLCQGTGLAVVFIAQGAKVLISPPLDKPDATLVDAINDGVAQGYQQGLLRKSVVGKTGKIQTLIHRP